ncbi:uncharacterized protein LOC127873076 isoform X2 [Dreissena polymorpha]|uniref:uncharacterized protein LOC127873076 isoform X2 n=1 Tax=Dreissena polymorpha TaxID=45954 RepID=UPI00226454E9|nr:uncharacterized protein LOC127873076 isoform X2 [Dreissena polymorpha]
MNFHLKMLRQIVCIRFCAACGYIQCTMKSVKDRSKCPHPGCDQSANLTDHTLQFFEAILNDMFKEYTVADDYAPSTTAASDGSSFTVSLLNGESARFPFNPKMEVEGLKSLVQKQMKHDVNKQKLLFREKELAVYLENGDRARLCDFHVQPNSNIMLMVLLFAIPEKINDVVFDLYWGYPSTGMDYLDASCLLFNGKQCDMLCDYARRQPCPAIRHSGDVMKPTQGHHTMNVSLKDLPSSITHLFFTLSAWRSANISRYPNPSLKFYEAANPNKDLCKTTFGHAGAYQAVVMCSLSRGKHGRWEIFESGKCSAGNARNYEPLKETIQSLIAQGF